MSQFALMFVPDPARALREMWRVLAPRGRLAVAVCGPIADAPGYAALAEVAERGCRPEVVELCCDRRSRSGTSSAWRAWSRDAGIEGAEIRTPALSGALPFDRCSGAHRDQASPIRDVIDERSFEALLEGARHSSPACTSHGGEVSFAMPAHIVTARKA